MSKIGGEPFDTKNRWLIDPKEGCIKCRVEKEEGDKYHIKLASDEPKVVNKDDVEPMNPPKFDKIEDMANMPELNESCVLHNLRERYFSNLIYTYSGLFLVVINPWRRLPIYTDEIVAMYKGKKRKDLPPHVFAVCDEAYRNMLESKENQSLLITGESGAGKTENTKKVIQYLASVAGTSSSDSNSMGGKLEQQILLSNPLLEAFGNAKTVRNNNSSRFGKFIRIEFSHDGKIVGCNIDNYLLEKSRVIRRAKSERSFHIFYQLLDGASAEIKEKLLLDSARHYKYLVGETTIEGVDNAKEYQETVAAMDTMNFAKEDQLQVWSLLSGILLFGNLEFSTTNRRDEAATIKSDNSPVVDKLCHVFGLKRPDFERALLKPQVKVGREWVTVMVTSQKAEHSCEALVKSLYERLFKWIVGRINQCMETHGRTNSFIGCLDIAGFEIFEVNSFEQLCINLTNEKLQQFFNHHMFILEQEEYQREGIEWKFIDFGMDLQPTIDLIEKPMGIMSILDEECLFPKATDKSFVEKLHSTHSGKNEKYGTIRLNPTMFTLAHYAGQVPYNTDSWLDKNKDPINDNVATLFSKSTLVLLAELFKDAAAEDGGAMAQRAGKASQFITVGQRHRQQLSTLMTTLKNTSPHFVRCIIPNEVKKPGIIDAPLVLDQLRCNGVLEGIRICRMGFPNRIPFAEFRQRYEILCPSAIPKGFMDGKVAAEKLLEAANVSKEEYRLGHSKVFFKAGVLTLLEERRDERLGELILGFQAVSRGYLARKRFRLQHGKEDAIRLIQKNARVFINLYQWPWWKLYRQVKPLLGVYRQEQAEKKLKDRIAELEELYKKEQELRQKLEAENIQLEKERDALAIELQTEKEALEDTIASLNRVEEKRRELQSLADELESQLDEVEEKSAELEKEKRALMKERDELKAKLEDDSDKLAAIEEMKKKLESEFEEQRAIWESEKKMLEESIETERKRREASANELKEQAAALNQNIERLKKELKNAGGQKDEMQELLTKTDSDRMAAEKAQRKAEDDLNAAKSALDKANHRLASVEEGKRSADAENLRLKSDLEEVETSKANISQVKNNLESELENVRSQLDDSERKALAAERHGKQMESELEELSEKREKEHDAMKEMEVQVRTLEAQLKETEDKLVKAAEAADNTLREALKAERIKYAALEEKLKFEKNMRISAEERLKSEQEKNAENSNKLNAIREALRK